MSLSSLAPKFAVALLLGALCLFAPAAAQAQTPPAAGDACTGNDFVWPDANGKVLHCVSSQYVVVDLGGTGGTSIIPLVFPNQSNVNTGNTIRSAPVTLYDSFTNATAICGTGCTSIAKNGIWGGTTVAGFNTGDTIAIAQTSSSSTNTTTTAFVTVGGTTSATWSVTTTNGFTSFSFTDQTGAAVGNTISSNAITLGGVYVGSATATCGTGCTAISRNGVWGGTSVGGFVVGDLLAIQQLDSSNLNTTTTATVSVGGTTSGIWSVTTLAGDPCAGVPAAGTVCADGSIYAAMLNGKKIYTTPCDVGMTGTKNNCTGTRSLPVFGCSGSLHGASSTTDGAANTTALVACSPNVAAVCDSLVAYGKSDWYLPASSEISAAFSMSTYSLIGSFIGTGSYYQTSTEASNTTYMLVWTIAGDLNIYGDKTGVANRYYIRCIRKEP